MYDCKHIWSNPNYQSVNLFKPQETVNLENELKIAYLKIRSTYISYKNKNTSKTEQEKINKIIKNNDGKIFGIDISHYQGIINWNKVNFLEDSLLK